MTAVRRYPPLLAALLLVVVSAVLLVRGIIHANQVSAHHSQEIANCVVALHETWAYCSKLYP